MSAERAVELKDLRKTYRVGLSPGRKPAVGGLTLSVESGEVFGLLGPNGAGKTTTLKMMLGMVSPDSGEGYLLGRPLGDRASRAGVGFLPEQSYFYGFLTAEKGLDLYGRLHGMSRSVRRARGAELLDLVGLRGGSHLTLGKYSKGMLQRFGIAQALINDPELLILDEPSSGLDPLGQKEVRDILLMLKEKGKTIFLSSHQLSEVENICDGVTIMSGGLAAREGRLADLLSLEGRTRITVRGGGLERLSAEGWTLNERDGTAVLDVPHDETWHALARVRELGLGLELVSVSPHKRSLEDIFLEAVRGVPA